MQFDTKIAIALDEDLAVWQKLNVMAFLASGVTGAYPDLLGEPYRDADGAAYHRLFRQPVVVLAGPRAALSRARARGEPRGLAFAVYTEGMFSTGHVPPTGRWWRRCQRRGWTWSASRRGVTRGQSTRRSTG